MKKILLTGLISVALMADYTISYQFEEDDEISVIDMMQYKNDKNIKLSYHYNNDSNIFPKRGLYVINGIRYSVEENDNNLTYRGVTQYGDMIDDCQANPNPFFRVIKKLEKEYIAGFEGEIWLVESKEDGVREQEKIVVSSNKELVQAVKTYFNTIKNFGEGAYGQEFDAEFQSMFMVAEGYVLIAAKGIELYKFEQNEIVPSTFELPKEAKKVVEVIENSEDDEV